MYRDEDDLQLLAELAGVLDQTVTEAGLSSGTYLILRELAATPDGVTVTTLAQTFDAPSEQVANAAGALVRDGLADIRASGVAIAESGRELTEAIETNANEAIRAYVLDRPHTATVYGLVASMQAGRFTVTDLLDFLAEGPGVPQDDVAE